MFPRLIDFGPVQLATYGALVAAGYLSAILWLRTRREEMGLDEDTFWSLIYRLFFGAIAGGKLLFLLVHWRSFAAGELGLLRDFRYGFVFFGGFLGSLALGAHFTRRRGLSFLRLADYFAVALPLGHAVGRLGCFAAGCCYGRPSDAPWAVAFTDPRSLVPAELLGVPLHPAQLYESAGNLALALGMLLPLRWVRQGRLPRGAAFGAYFALYAALRFAVETFRGDDRGGFALGLSPSQWIALGFLAAALVLAARLRGRRAA